MTLNEIITIILAIIAVIIALWQGYLSKIQLDESKRTKSETEKLLDEIHLKVNKIEDISDETRKDVKEQISRLIDKQDENFKMLLSAPKETNQKELLMSLVPKLMENPDLFSSLLQMSQKGKI